MRYPIFLDLAGEPVVVIGAGKIAARKISSLLNAGACVTVISPTAMRAIQHLVGAAFPPRPDRSNRGHEAAPTRQIRWIRRRYRRGDLAGARLVVAATDDLRVNQLVCTEAKRRGLLVNCVAPPSAGNFHVPAVARRTGVAIAISTDGHSPTFAKRLRQELEQFLRDRYPRGIQ
jgi:precorrin-2 dehydrogenase/sirohydrochlorin ferrochelatase